MQFHDLLGNGQAQPGAAGAGGPGAVQPEELVEDPVQLLLGDGLAGVDKGQGDGVPVPAAGDAHLRAGEAVVGGVAQQVVEHPGEFFPVAGAQQLLRQVQAAGEVRLRQHGAELADHLLEHPGQVRGLLLQFQIIQLGTQKTERLFLVL